MKKIVTATLLLTAILAAEKIRMSYAFNEPVIQNQNDFQSITVTGCYNYGKEGEPSLPYLSSTILLPPGEEIQSLTVLDAIYASSKDNIKIQPAGKIVPISQMDKLETTLPLSQIYNSTAYTDKIVENQVTSFLAGHSIGSFTICPVNYQPANKKVQFLKSVTVEIETAPTERAGKAFQLLSNSTDLKFRVEALVENKNFVSRYNYPETTKNEQYDILLITNNMLKPAFDNFIQYKLSVGYLVKTVSVEDIINSFSGADTQEKIRNCIKQYYMQNSISAVILGGDADTKNPVQNIIPCRGFYADPGSDTYIDNNIPSDLYYSCLDGNWNSNGNDKFGEDGEEDFLAEVLIGRICADNITEVSNFTNKIIKYQKQPVVSDIGKALFLGEKLWEQPLPNGTYAGPSLNQLVYGATTVGGTTVGFNANPFFQITRLYAPQINWEASNVFSEFNTNGVNLLNHYGHSSNDVNMLVSTSQVNTANFQNNGVNRGYVIGYSQGCYAGSFDNRVTTPNSYNATDCFAELITCLPTGEVASIANSRYGWGEQGGTNGPSQFFHRQFIDAIFGENITVIGKVNQDSKDDNLSYITQSGAGKWVAYDATLFGDPTMDIWTAAPVDLSPIYTQNLSMGAANMEISSLPAGARVGVMKNNQLIGRAVAGSNGKAVVSFFSPISTTDPLTLTITAHNKKQFTTSIAIAINEPFVTPVLLSIDDAVGNGNGQADINENIKLGLNLKNIGLGTANTIKAVITSASSKMTISDSNELFGSINEGVIVSRPQAFALHLVDSIPDQYSMPVKLDIYSNNILKWTNNLNFNINAPNPVLNTCVINEIGGNNNGFLDPGETANLKIDYLNNGHYLLNSGNMTLSCNNPNIQLLQNSAATEALAVNGTGFKEFKVKAVTIATGTEVKFTVVWNAGGYKMTKSFMIIVGISENFESNNFTANPWQFEGNTNWQIDGTVAYNGKYSAKSGSITHNQTSGLKLKAKVNTDGKIIYYKKVSSENEFDFFNFYIDGQRKEGISGEQPWSMSEFPISAGDHNLKWEYQKDGVGNGGSDCAWIDLIILQGGTMSLINDVDNLPLVNELFNNYPNPFNPSTTIKFAITQKMNIKLTVFDIAGRQIATITKESFPAGKHSLEFNGFRFASGIYFYQLEGDGKVIGRNKMMLVK